jgi:hypothetical protein
VDGPGTRGLPAGGAATPVWAPLEAATTPGGGTRPWLEDVTTGDALADPALPGVVVTAAPGPVGTWAEGSTPLGGADAVPAATRPLLATPDRGEAASGPAGATATGLAARGDEVVGAEPGERPATGSGRS